MSEYESEPVRGLPGRLPPGETMLWQGAPDWRMLARVAFHVRGVAIYFALLTAFGLATGSVTGAITTVVAAILCIGLLYGLAWATSRTTVYTLTDKRIVFRVGVALPKCLNLPLALVEAADLRSLPDGRGDIALRMGSNSPLGYLLLWPHARPWRLRRPEPMLRALPDAQAIAALIVSACAARVPVEPRVASQAPAVAPERMPMVVAA